MITKSDTITEIMRLNPSVGATFLSEFTNDQLVRYLHRLRDLRKPTQRRVQSLPSQASQFLRSDAVQPA